MIKSTEFLRRHTPRSRGDVSPYVVLSGDEEFLRAECRQAIIKKLGDETDVIDVQWGDSEERRDLLDLLDELRTPSLFGPSKVVVVRNADVFLAEHGGSLETFVQREEPAAVLILEGENIVKKKGRKVTRPKVVDAMEKAEGVVVDCAAPYARSFGFGKPVWESELTTWVVERATLIGKTLAPEDAHALHEREGGGLRAIAGQLEKLSLHVGDRPDISRADIEEVVGGLPESTVFEVVDRFGLRDGPGALDAALRLFVQGIPDERGRRSLDPTGIALRLVTLLATRLRELGRIMEHRRQGSSFEDAAAAVLGAGRKWLFPRFRSQLECWSVRDVGESVLALSDLDYELKTGRGEPQDLLPRFLVRYGSRPVKRGASYVRSS